MGSVLKFLNRMDKSAWRAVGVSAALFVVVAAILVFGKLVLMNGESGEGILSKVELLLVSLKDHPLGLPALILLFCTMAFIGAPQFGLIAVAVVAFGPVLGFVYAWIAAMCSMAMTFWVGRFMGVETVRKYGGDTVNRISRFVGKNDFLASMIVRNVPTAPFIIVNMAFGVSHAKFWRFWAGAGIGVIPKTALVAFGGGAVMAAIKGNPWLALLAVLGSLLIWAPLMLFARRRVTEQDDVSV
ncbi:TVP38/TMEM64 family protein [Hirschia baltica]|uniref:TVP38/TMEM64 family membrane protein n=1 Tax=Hirschia baltica (strain ATCC 49814 / DSM 5838 / IFAM 1418) TaxID=582402 RepID=C6XN09_HIRBI|nr:VTT domain-containing protein [Hirschia baltica]ACT58179.1 SNARE associated Golgi protein [Hirschia baltica ATCC 49814]